jgi:hypothetical protein
MDFPVEELRLQAFETVPNDWVAVARQAVTFEYKNHGAMRKAHVTVWYEFVESSQAMNAVAFEWYLKNRCADTSVEDLALEIATLLDVTCKGGIKVVLTADVGTSEQVTIEVKRVTRR